MMLTQPRLREALQYLPETGEFVWLERPSNRVRIGDIAGSISRGYVTIRVDVDLYRASRLASLYMTGRWPCGDVDHINGVKHDNRWANLRDVPHAVNIQNERKARSTSSTGILGIRPHGPGFQARIKLDGKTQCLGTFATSAEAHAAYVAGKRRLHEGCTL
jgi:hypothetical protein